jgi:nucleoid-associated protein YgaU
MRTDAKVALVAVLIIVVLVIIYFAFRNPSSRTAENNALPSAQPALVEAPNLPGSSPVPPALTQPSQTQPGLVSLPATAATSMPATMPSMADQTATSMPSLATGQTTAASPTAGPASATGTTADNSNATLSLNTPAADTGNSGLNATNSSNAGNSVNAGSADTAGNGNTNATLSFPPVNSGSTGSASSVALGSRRHRHRSRTLTLSAPHGGIYIVRKNDTLASISRRIYGSERMIHALERANPGLDPRRMRIGQRIRLPHRGRTAVTGTSHRVRHHTYASSSRSGRTYVVRAGEDLSSIARRFYGNPGLWRRIYNANRRIIGSSPNKLRAGERIVIPPK